MTARPLLLLVEDNPITRKLVRFALQHEPIELLDATDGASAMAAIAARRPDIILQDLLLPDIDGFALVAAFREQRQLDGVPILAFSGLLSQFDDHRLVKAGFTDLVTKPIEPSKLVRLIRAHLPTTGAAAPRFGHRRRIVLADDDDAQRKLSAFKLSRVGFEVIEAPNGQAALEAAQATPPAAIVTDAMMPVLDGFGLARAVRRDPALKDVPVVMLTSTYVDAADRELGRLAGANAFVIRTPDMREMIGALDDVLKAGPAAAPPVAGPAPAFEREHASRTLAQLERQAAAAAAARQQCATLSAELTVLNAISEAITQDTDIDVVLREILAACCDAAGVSIGALYLRRPGGGFRTLIVGQRAGGDEERADPFSGNGGAARLQHFIDAGVAGSLSQASDDPDTRAWLARTGLRSAVVVPLQHKGDKLGAMVMMSESGELGGGDRLLFAESVGHQVSVALALTQAFEDSATAAEIARERARLLQSVFGTMMEPVLVTDRDGRQTMWNDATSALIDVAATHRLVLDPEWPGVVGAFATDKTTLLVPHEMPMARALSGEDVESVDIYLRNDKRPDGVWLKANARPLRDDAGTITGAVGIARDVTKERQAHEQLMISDRMASIGLMAAGVGHEINNPLSAVISNLELAAGEVAALAASIGPGNLGELPDEIAEALDAARRVQRIAGDLKLFSGGQAEENLPVDVERVLDSAVRMGWSQIHGRARVTKQYGAAPPALGAEGRLGQVFLNLLVNAAQAMPDRDLDRNEIRLTTRVADDGRILIDVADTGSGIPPEVMRQLFTPFVTTKPVGIGTGLGLSICQRLIGAMGGEIWAETVPGQGTVFHVALAPADVAAPAPAPVDAAPAAAPAPVRTQSRILVVDDEDMIGHIMRRLLKAHHVTVMASARDALAAIDGGTRYDLILCDVMMPDLTGIEFHRALSERHPALARAVIFLTGGAYNKETMAFLDSVPNGYLEKPFDIAKLRASVAAQLAAASSDDAPPPEAA